jgi:hypothetical protein
MLRDSTPSRLHTASCLEDNDHTEDNTGAGENMKQSFIMSNESLEDEEQTKLQEERQCRSIICKGFLLGSSIGFALQGLTFLACYMILKMFGENPKPTPGSLLSCFSYSMLFLVSQLDIVMYGIIWLTFMYTMTKSGSLYMRKKFDKDAANPKSGSIWTARMLFIVGIYVLFGAVVGSFALWMIADLRIGMVVPLMPLFNTVMIDFVLFLVMIKCFDCGHSGYTAEEELDDDSYFV